MSRRFCWKPFYIRKRGLTLVEVLIALLILGLFALAVREALSVSTGLYRSLSEVGADSEAGLAMLVLNRDFRGAALDKEKKSSIFSGHPVSDFYDAIRFTTTTRSLETVSIKILPDPSSARMELWRISETSGRRIFLLDDVQKFKLKYFDGHAWHDQWGWDNENQKPYGGIRGLPVLISVSIAWTDRGDRVRARTAIVPVMISLLNAR